MKCLAFDLGRVLFDFDYNIALNRIKDRVKTSPQDIINALFYKDFGTDFEKGFISSKDFFRKFVKEFGADIDYDEFVRIWCEVFWPKDDMIDLVKRLRSAYRVYLISNINELHFNYLKENYPDVFSLFEGLVLSFKARAVKPEVRIYKELQNISGCPYGSIIYIDDRGDLIDEAKRFGLNCIKFNSFYQLVDGLKKYSIFIPAVL